MTPNSSSPEDRGVVDGTGAADCRGVGSRSGAGAHEVSNRSTVVPMTIWSPSDRTRSRMVAPLTLVPLVELRSTTTTSLPVRRISAWRRLALGSLTTIVLSGRRPMVIGSGPSTTRMPSASTTEAADRPGRALVDVRDHGEAAPALAGVLHHRDGDRAHEDVLLGAGVLAGRLLELADQGVQEALEAVEVRGRQVDDEGVGRDEAVDAQAPLEVHLPGHPTADLHRMELAPEGLGEGAVDHALEAPFELLQSHVGVSLPVSTPW